MLTVRLTSCGNPDFRQDPSRPLPGVKPQTLQVADLEAASRACRRYIMENELGNGNWSGGQVYDGKKLIGQVSFNGIVWPPGKWTTEMQPIYKPTYNPYQP